MSPLNRFSTLPVSRTTTRRSSVNNDRLSHTTSHQPPDLSFPYLTSSPSRLAEEEYRTETSEGYIPTTDEEVARQITPPGALISRPSTLVPSTIDGVLHDLERGKEKKLVTFNEGDPANPRNWSNVYRWYITAVVAIAVIQVAFASAVVTGDFIDQEEHFRVSAEVIALTVSLMVCGFGVGPLLWSPLSELLGRQFLWIFPTFIYIIFNIPCALAPNIGCLLASRFLAGFFGSAPLTLAGGTISDVWGPEERGFAIAIFAAAPYGGPVLGPLVGGFVGKYAGWRWLYWVNMIFAGVVWVFTLTVPETFVPTILKWRAKALRRKTGDKSYCTVQEVTKRPLSEIVVETLVRPFQMIVTEPILLLMSLYIALVYGLLYAFFFSFPVVFGEDYGWDDAKIGLTFCSVFIGIALALLITPKLETRYIAKGTSVTPEDRLPGMLIGGPFVPISLFIFGWTAPPYVTPHGGSWVGPTSAGIPFGFGMVLVYFSANAYLIEAFPDYVASALAAKTVIRSGAGAAMPLFIAQMFRALGNGGAASLLGGVAIVMAIIPFAFKRYGKQIRAKSKRAAS